MEILVAPISGPRFAAQVACLAELCKREYKPDLSFAGSGGGVSIYIASAAYWNPAKIHSVCSQISTKSFVADWTTSMLNVIPGKLKGLMFGSFYKSSDEGMKVLMNHLTMSTIQNTEIWVASINEKTGDVLLCCNKEKDTSIVKGEKINGQLCNYEPLAFFSGNLRDISLAILASACIPVYVSPIEIHGEKYIDCGTKHGSSFAPMFSEVLEIAKSQPVHIIYLTGCDLSRRQIPSSTGIEIFDCLADATTHGVQSQIQNDRNMAYFLIMKDCEDEPNYQEFDSCDFDFVYENRKKARRSLFEIYPRELVGLDLFNFTPEDLNKCILEYSHLLQFRVWWSGDKDIFY